MKKKKIINKNKFKESEKKYPMFWRDVKSFRNQILILNFIEYWTESSIKDFPFEEKDQLYHKLDLFFGIDREKVNQEMKIMYEKYNH